MARAGSDATVSFASPWPVEADAFLLVRTHCRVAASLMQRMISVVVPVFRSAATLATLYQRLAVALDECASDWEIILVDDASDDGSFQAMQALRAADPRVKLVRFARNSGQHAATLCGMKRARGDYVFTIDDDLQLQPEEMSKFIDKIESGYDLAIGRIVGAKRHSWLRNLGSASVQWMIERIIGKPSRIALSSYRCMTRRAVDRIGAYTGAHPYLPALMFGSVPHDRIANVDIVHVPRAVGRSTYSLRKLVKLASYLLINHSYLPLRLFTAWGLVLSALSVAYAGYVAVDVLVHGSPLRGWPSLVVLVSFLAGNILLYLGVIGEYIGRLVEEASRPRQFPVFEEEF
jgi:glycosyltransferase involved in cell wall biosynthesis